MLSSGLYFIHEAKDFKEIDIYMLRKKVVKRNGDRTVI